MIHSQNFKNSVMRSLVAFRRLGEDSEDPNLGKNFCRTFSQRVYVLVTPMARTRLAKYRIQVSS